MSANFDDFQILKAAEAIADSVWKHVVEWDEFARGGTTQKQARRYPRTDDRI